MSHVCMYSIRASQHICLGSCPLPASDKHCMAASRISDDTNQLGTLWHVVYLYIAERNLHSNVKPV